MSTDEKQIDPRVLETIQKDHLDWLESFGRMFAVNGVPIVLALDYELIQAFNSLVLSAMVGESDG